MGISDHRHLGDIMTKDPVYLLFLVDKHVVKKLVKFLGPDLPYQAKAFQANNILFKYFDESEISIEIIKLNYNSFFYCK